MGIEHHTPAPSLPPGVVEKTAPALCLLKGLFWSLKFIKEEIKTSERLYGT